MALSNNVNKLSRERNKIRVDLRKLLGRKKATLNDGNLTPFLHRMSKLANNSVAVRAQLISGIGGNPRNLRTTHVKVLYDLYQKSKNKQKQNALKRRVKGVQRAMVNLTPVNRAQLNNTLNAFKINDPNLNRKFENIYKKIGNANAYKKHQKLVKEQQNEEKKKKEEVRVRANKIAEEEQKRLRGQQNKAEQRRQEQQNKAEQRRQERRNIDNAEIRRRREKNENSKRVRNNAFAINQLEMKKLELADRAKQNKRNEASEEEYNIKKEALNRAEANRIAKLSANQQKAINARKIEFKNEFNKYTTSINGMTTNKKLKNQSSGVYVESS